MILILSYLIDIIAKMEAVEFSAMLAPI